MPGHVHVAEPSPRLGARGIGRHASRCELLYPRLEESLEARDSLFPPALRPFVPSFYFWDFSSYWTYPPNLVAYACVAALVLIGALAARSGRTGASLGA